MQSINLYTRSGTLVATIGMSDSSPGPDVVLWGVRAFAWSEDHQQYRECHVLVVPVRPEDHT